jgi:hypothetical protein
MLPPVDEVEETMISPSELSMPRPVGVRPDPDIWVSTTARVVVSSSWIPRLARLIRRWSLLGSTSIEVVGPEMSGGTPIGLSSRAAAVGVVSKRITRLLEFESLA